MRISTFTIASLAFLTICLLSAPANAQFSGTYAPGNWTLTNVDADGFVDTSGAPSSLRLFGGDLGVFDTNGDVISGTTTYSIVSGGNGTVSFTWNYASVDTPGFDGFDFLLNGASVVFADTDGQNGVFSTGVSTGDSLAFRLFTLDNFFGRGSVTVSNFAAPAGPVSPPGPGPGTPAVPEPGEYAVMGMAGLTLCGLMVRARRRRAA